MYVCVCAHTHVCQSIHLAIAALFSNSYCTYIAIAGGGGGEYIINPRRMRERGLQLLVCVCVCVCVCLCVSVCLSGLNLRLQGSRATNYYTYVFFTMNARFNMCGVR